jgi:hypothetical protein
VKKWVFRPLISRRGPVCRAATVIASRLVDGDRARRAFRRR